tara:strand:- start:173 stop:334 length:162 start_codon:yes stop_codon:yes gene_type:complete
MKNFLFVIIIFLYSCTSNTARFDFNFSDEMSFDEFKIKLEEYAKNNPYPNIDY